MEIVLAPDFDEAGRAALKKWALFIMDYNKSIIVPKTKPVEWFFLRDILVPKGTSKKERNRIIFSLIRAEEFISIPDLMEVFGISMKTGEMIFKRIDDEDDYFREQERIWKKQRLSLVEREKIFEKSKDVKEIKDKLFVSGKMTTAMIKTAAEVPIEEFTDTGFNGFTECIFHNENTPSMHITRNKFYCFGCNAKGDTINYVMKLKNISLKKAVKYILNGK